MSTHVSKEIATYIRFYFYRFLTREEKAAFKHLIYSEKIEASESEGVKRNIIERGLLSTDPKVLNLLKDGGEAFELEVARRVIADNGDKVFFNTCPKCKKIARTPFARQCRHCGHSWHNLTIGYFRFKKSSQQASGTYSIIGELIKGTVEVGNFIDLSPLGLNEKPKIVGIKLSNSITSDTEISVSDLTEDGKNYLQNCAAFWEPLYVVTAK